MAYLRRSTPARRWVITALLLLALASLTVWGGGSRTVTSAPDPAPTVGSAQAPLQLTVAHPHQKLYRIDTTQSTARYAVQEVLLGTLEGRLVTGVSQRVQGEILLDFANPAASQVGPIVVNVAELTSDSRLRDRRLRTAYLESARYPEVTFVATPLRGFPTQPQLGAPITFPIHGTLTVKATTIATPWAVTATLTERQLVGRATTMVRMSDFGVGPIDIAGLLETADALQLQVDFVALPTAPRQPTATRPVTATVLITPPQPLAGAPEFYANVAPILAKHCTGCHIAGQIGHAVYPMETVRDAVAYADDLALVVGHGYMPPWPPGTQTPPLQQARTLTEADRATLLAWAAAGAPVAGALDTPLEPWVDSSVPTLRPDLTVSMAEPYLPTGQSNDDYRCFLIDPGLDEARFFTGYHLIPGEVSIVHHMILFVVDEGARAEAAARAYADGRPGWQCFGDDGLPGTTSSVAISWTPGEGAVLFPAGTGVPVDGDSLFVMHRSMPTCTSWGRLFASNAIQRRRRPTCCWTFRTGILIGKAPIPTSHPSPSSQATSCESPVSMKINRWQQGQWPSVTKLPAGMSWLPSAPIPMTTLRTATTATSSGARARARRCAWAA